jgi:hypothetical protein
VNTEIAHGSVVGWGAMMQARRSQDLVPMRWIFYLPIPSSRTMSLGSTQPLTETSTRTLPGSKGRPARKAWQTYRHLWADCLDKMWEPRRLTTLWAFTACYRDSFTFSLHKLLYMFRLVLAFYLLSCDTVQSGTLSCPGWVGHVTRAEKIRAANILTGTPLTSTAFATCVWWKY